MTFSSFCLSSSCEVKNCRGVVVSSSGSSWKSLLSASGWMSSHQYSNWASHQAVGSKSQRRVRNKPQETRFWVLLATKYAHVSVSRVYMFTTARFQLGKNLRRTLNTQSKPLNATMVQLIGFFLHLSMLYHTKDQRCKLRQPALPGRWLRMWPINRQPIGNLRLLIFYH